jgi:hypothetical protein
VSNGIAREVHRGRDPFEVLAAAIASLRGEFDDHRSTVLARLASSSAIRKTATQSFTSTTFDDDTELRFDIQADEAWAFEFILNFDGATAGDLAGEVTAPAGATLAMQAWGPQVAATFTGTAASPIQTAGSIAAGGDFQFGCAGAGTVLAGRLVGIVSAGSTPGTVQLRVGQAAGSATPTRIFVDSFVSIRRVA